MRNIRLFGMIVFSFVLLTGCGTQLELDTAESTVPTAAQEHEAEAPAETTETETASETLPETTETETASETLPETTEAETKPETLAETTEAETDLPEIFLIEQTIHVNWYGTHTVTQFADVSGAVYYVNNAPRYDDPAVFETFRLFQKHTEPMLRLDAETLQTLCTLGESIAPESEYEIETYIAAADSGSNSFLFRNPETGEMTTCYHNGNGEVRRIQDASAQELMSSYHKAAASLSSGPDAFRMIYTPDDAPFLRFAAESEISGNYLLKDEEEVKQFAQQCNVPFDAVLTDTVGDDQSYDSGEYVYFLELNAPPAEGMLYAADETDQKYTFLHSQQELSGYCNLFACSVYDRDSFLQQHPTASDGTEWQRISD